MVDQIVAMRARGRSLQFSLELDPTEFNDAFLLEHCGAGRCYEPEMVWVLFRTLREGDVAIDAGANIGFFTLTMAHLVGLTGKVIACEPEVVNLGRLKRHVETSGLKNISIIDKPLWGREEEVTFYVNADSSGGHSLFNPGTFATNSKSRANPSFTKMRATTLDHVAPVRTKLIKIDTEGAEQQVLEGAAELLRVDRPAYILIELNPQGLLQAGRSVGTLRAYMQQFGYSLFTLHVDDRLPALVPDNSRIEFVDGVQVVNAMFSTLENVGAAWPEVFG